MTKADYSTGELFEYDYDAASNRIAMTSTTPLSGTVVTAYTYDAANRLTEREVSDSRTYTYTWSNRNQLLAEYTQGYPVRTFSYDAAGQMITATVFTLTTHFTYNGDGARIGVSVEGHGATTYTLDYAAGYRVLAESTGITTTLYLYGHECLGELRDDEWLYYLTDGTGYVRQGVDDQGEVVSVWLFDPDGTVLEGPEGLVSHLVCGGVYDWSTGLLYKDGRYFDPLLGIWLALTPLAVLQLWRRRKKSKGAWDVLLVAMVVVGVGATVTACNTPTPIPTLVCTETPTLPTPTIDYCAIGAIGVKCPTPTSMLCEAGSSYARCFESNPISTGIMEFAPGERIDQAKLDELVEAISNRLKSKLLPPGRTNFNDAGEIDFLNSDPGRFLFDTPFHNAGEQELTDIKLIYQGKEYRRSEVNYIGQGMWGAAAGETLEHTLEVCRQYKRWRWHEDATPGVIFWATYGHNAY